MKYWLVQLCLILILDLYASTADQFECGKPKDDDVDRIVHGRDIGYVRYPWFATLLLAKMKNRLMCGGTLIGPRHVLTAAHCIKPFFKNIEKGTMKIEEIYNIKLGVNNICKEDNKTKLFSSAKVFVHEKYKELMPYFDIALIELDQDAVGYMPICLPSAWMDDRNRSGDGLIVGLGKESSHAWKLPCTVKEARIMVYNDTICKDMLKRMDEDTSTFQNAFCAGYLEGGIDTCQGDSGGPFQAVNSENRFELRGITSFGFGCAAPGVLGVYTDVSHYLDWIYDKMYPTPVATTQAVPVQNQPFPQQSYTIDKEEYLTFAPTQPFMNPAITPSVTPPERVTPNNNVYYNGTLAVEIINDGTIGGNSTAESTTANITSPLPFYPRPMNRRRWKRKRIHKPFNIRSMFDDLFLI